MLHKFADCNYLTFTEESYFCAFLAFGKFRKLERQRAIKERNITNKGVIKIANEPHHPAVKLMF